MPGLDYRGIPSEYISTVGLNLELFVKLMDFILHVFSGRYFQNATHITHEFSRLWLQLAFQTR